MHEAIGIELIIVPVGRMTSAVHMGGDTGTASDGLVVTTSMLAENHCAVGCEPDDQDLANRNGWRNQRPSKQYLQTTQEVDSTGTALTVAHKADMQIQGECCNGDASARCSVFACTSL